MIKATTRNGIKKEYIHFSAKELFNELWDKNEIDTYRFTDENPDFFEKELTDEEYVEYIEDYADAYVESV